MLWQSETDVKAKKGAKTEKKRKSNHPDEEGQFTMAGAITKGRRRGCGNTTRSAVAIPGRTK